MGLLISFEGIDGAGKSTHVAGLKKRLETEGYRCEVFREPGGTELSEEIRTILLHHKGEMDPVAELLLFSAARAQLISEKVKPLLDKPDTIVILDRFFDSTTAYQGYARNALDPDEIKKINRIAAHQVKPDITFYLRLDIGKALSRLKDEKDRMEQSGDEFYKLVQQGFDALAEEEPRFVRIDAGQAIETVHELIWSNFKNRMKDLRPADSS